MNTYFPKNGLAYLFLIGILLIIHLSLYQYAFDDAYIHFRVAQNLIEDGKPYFNELDPLKVSTSSAWVVFLAGIFAVAKIFNAVEFFPVLIAVFNSCISAWISFVYCDIAQGILQKPLTTLQKMLLKTSLLAAVLPASIGLMETPLALLLTGIAIYRFLQWKPSSFYFLGLAIYLRLELIVLLALLGIYVFIKRRNSTLSFLGFLFLSVSPFAFFDLFYYKTLVPHSVLAKPLIYTLELEDVLVDIFINSIPASVFSRMVAITVSTLIFAILLWVIVRDIFTKNTNVYMVLFVGWGTLVICGYVFGKALLFEWYIPLYTLPIFFAVYVYSIKYSKNILLILLLSLITFFSVLFLGSLIYSAAYNPSAFVLFESGSRVRSYLYVGKILRSEYPNATLLTSEIGGLGYSFSGEVLDAAGLASAAALDFHPMRIPEDRRSGYLGAIPPHYVKLTQPDLIVSYDIFAEALLRDTVLKQYHIITLPAYLPEDARFSKSLFLWQSKYLRVFINKSLPFSNGICPLVELSEESSTSEIFYAECGFN